MSMTARLTNYNAEMTLPYRNIQKVTKIIAIRLTDIFYHFHIPFYALNIAEIHLHNNSSATVHTLSMFNEQLQQAHTPQR
jgi:hypothetical protein